jgi:dihydrofolate reductase
MKTYLLNFTILLFVLIQTSSPKCNLQAQIDNNTGWKKAVDSAAFSPRAKHLLVLFKDKLWLIGGHDSNHNFNDVWYSDDGINWILAANKTGFEIKYGTKVFVFNEKLWLIIDNNIWNSPDGIQWEKVSTVASLCAGEITVFDNKIWITGGAEVINPYLADGKLNPARKVIWKNDIWVSSDGIDWTKVKSQKSFSERCDHSLLVFKNKMWIVAGQSGPNKNDIWCSDDGINWEFICYSPFTARHVTQVVSFDNKLWVIGGFAMNNSGYPILLSDIWNSEDGRNWEQITNNAPFSTRQEHQVIIFKNKIWLIGGYSGTFNNRIYKNDIWYNDAQMGN